MGIGKRIYDLDGLYRARTDRRSVVVPSSHSYKKPLPAATFMNLSGELLLRLFQDGMYIYEKGDKR